ncbi:MAG: YggS family pyridoxal phosphate-dependent enzyme [Methylobacter sp.]|uniref:YggS family pyridoxal phosphate-dependent enzyme n=1 Tax=Methylobacter sp. TaxID=2051955 RepID=UPI00272F1326|nr:YggS family pyridoxal phosphate-dependent enzyme [Methylobacter sp.]MDP1666407.1 YggS family pyridoxal phosphate-dependent enzyme [Methylobacter sp.]MDP1970730.1 YggS family pyridoxal phosphate-dependent enzyme [Methylobacter sp.]
MTTTIAQRFKQIRSQISDAELACNRQPGSVLLLAVSKTKPAEDIAAAYQAGQRHFGENYLQEALRKQQELGAYDITWHFIGPIQSNKTKPLATHFDWVHSVDSLKIAGRLSAQRPAHLPPLNICLQVNISDEPSKSGITLAELPQLCEQVAKLPKLKLRGVMAIPAPQDDFEQQCQPYKTLYQAVAKLHRPELDTFSFGMTGDLKAAIVEGSTIVRIGTALFGERDYS